MAVPLTKVFSISAKGQKPHYFVLSCITDFGALKSFGKPCFGISVSGMIACKEKQPYDFVFPCDNDAEVNGLIHRLLEALETAWE